MIGHLDLTFLCALRVLCGRIFPLSLRKQATTESTEDTEKSGMGNVC